MWLQYKIGIMCSDNAHALLYLTDYIVLANDQNNRHNAKCSN